MAPGHKRKKPSEKETSSSRKKVDIKDSKEIIPSQMNQSDYKLPQIPQITNEWVAASETRNYVLDDPLIDWLNMWGEKKGFKPDKKYPDYDENLDFSQFIMKQGVKFEAMIMQKLQAKFGTELVTVSSA